MQAHGAGSAEVLSPKACPRRTSRRRMQSALANDDLGMRQILSPRFRRWLETRWRAEKNHSRRCTRLRHAARGDSSALKFEEGGNVDKPPSLANMRHHLLGLACVIPAMISGLVVLRAVGFPRGSGPARLDPVCPKSKFEQKDATAIGVGPKSLSTYLRLADEVGWKKCHCQQCIASCFQAVFVRFSMRHALTPAASPSTLS